MVVKLSVRGPDKMVNMPMILTEVKGDDDHNNNNKKIKRQITTTVIAAVTTTVTIEGAAVVVEEAEGAVREDVDEEVLGDDKNNRFDR
jgi:hypothetical protein